MLTRAQEARAAELADQGASWKEIARKLGVTDKAAKSAAERGAKLSPADLTLEKQRRQLMARRHRRLDDRERQVMWQRLGLRGWEPKTLAEIAAQMGLSKQRVSQIEAAAWVKLEA